MNDSLSRPQVDPIGGAAAGGDLGRVLPGASDTRWAGCGAAAEPAHRARTGAAAAGELRARPAVSCAVRALVGPCGAAGLWALVLLLATSDRGRRRAAGANHSTGRDELRGGTAGRAARRHRRAQ